MALTPLFVVELEGTIEMQTNVLITKTTIARAILEEAIVLM